MKITSDYLVVGSGIAGLCYALSVADRGRVALITKREIATTATRLAQGGIAAVASSNDSFEQHMQDTMEAGAWLPDEKVVRMVVENGPAAIQALVDWGVQFSRSKDASYDLTREGGHSQRRIYHVKDETGKEIERALVEAVQAHPNINIYENHTAVDLITEAKVTRRRIKPDRCLGVYVLNCDTGQVITFGASI
ncbi:MAG: FAD-dependent oxidoreductase, partial [Desulfuromonadales bacterium]